MTIAAEDSASDSWDMLSELSEDGRAASDLSAGDLSAQDLTDLEEATGSELVEHCASRSCDGWCEILTGYQCAVCERECASPTFRCEDAAPQQLFKHQNGHHPQPWHLMGMVKS